MVLALRQLVGGQNNMLRNKIISIVALAVIGPASPTGAFARGGGGGHGGGGFHGEEAVFTQVAAAFAAADFAGAGSDFSVHTPTVTIPTIMAMTTRAAAIWSLGGS
jgi:hypothetical protein